MKFIHSIKVVRRNKGRIEEEKTMVLKRTGEENKVKITHVT